MKWKLVYVLVALMTFGLGVAVVSFTYSAIDHSSTDKIPGQALSEPPCNNEETASQFPAFWHDFRDAVQRDDKIKLFSMIEKCNFGWEPFDPDSGLRYPLEADYRYDPFPLESPFHLEGARSTWGGHLRFRTYEQFLANYDVIFSEGFKTRLVDSDPTTSEECRYAISWEGEVLHHLCFEDNDGKGFKFTGLRFEP
ncbi:MAG TPA: hypothetical protein VLB68_08405 [Pyrinomonadaceae bacterium]|nr:hypothetical protein [Pyrinomonadaceae bacterium]